MFILVNKFSLPPPFLEPSWPFLLLVEAELVPMLDKSDAKAEGDDTGL